MKKYEMILDTYMPLKDAAEVFQKIAERKKEQLKQRHIKREKS
ncbi:MULTISPECIES: hypothetical protein [Mammaliicoccus]|uniref:Uncharacterized protein n=1 Tax=Mammaliicoccus sciuri TaxID=1296 RepID=A0ABT7HVA1_MAMSC|nr:MULTISPECIES: hypothetical protein [Mammaliicoccus]MDL0112495.1 hypothetical protein [Mammaliicoccus sciuri]MDL0116072.1 hypothetical protein [Mammaliicoccus sciuri]MDO0947503.1 hypothetical protein [Mammaliicoccus sciuri]MDO0954009.1 hypothetical protein [Mammaliicoccus sciuri]WQJ65094.1 hypothetical protein P3T97_09975 [Mammaliicoccus sciuri]